MRVYLVLLAITCYVIYLLTASHPAVPAATRGVVTAVLRDRAASTGGAGVGRVLDNNKGKVLENNKEKVLENNKEKVLEKENNKEKVLENNKEKVLENNKEKVLENNKEKVLDNNKEKVLDNNKEKVLDNNKGKVLDNNRGKVLDNNRGKVLDNNRGKVLDNGGGKVLDNNRGKVLDNDGGKVPDNSGGDTVHPGSSSPPLLTLFSTWADNKDLARNLTMANWAQLRPAVLPVLFTDSSVQAARARRHGWHTMPVTTTAVHVPVLKYMYLDAVRR